MLQPKTIYSSKSKQEKLSEKKEDKFGTKKSGTKMIVKPIDIDEGHF